MTFKKNAELYVVIKNPTSIGRIESITETFGSRPFSASTGSIFASSPSVGIRTLIITTVCGTEGDIILSWCFEKRKLFAFAFGKYGENAFLELSSDPVWQVISFWRYEVDGMSMAKYTAVSYGPFNDIIPPQKKLSRRERGRKKYGQKEGKICTTTSR